MYKIGIILFPSREVPISVKLSRFGSDNLRLRLVNTKYIKQKVSDEHVAKPLKFVAGGPIGPHL